jgi:ketosteroid isomerase-like protein
MSQKNVELVRAFVAQRILDLTEEDLGDYFDPDVELIALRSVTEGSYRGYAGLLRFQADNAATFEKFEQRYDVLEVGERVLATGTLRVRGAGSGVEMDSPAHIAIEFRHGRISRWHAFGSKAEALKALGLAE